MLTVRCFQIAVVRQERLYSATQPGKRFVKILNEIEQRPAAGFVELANVFLGTPLGWLILRHFLREIAVDATRAVVRGVHARTRHRLVAVHQVFALTEAEQEHRHRADIEPMRTEPHQVVQNARDLVEHDADVLGARRRLDAEQLLDCQHVAVLVAHHRDVVEPVHVTDRLVVRFRLGQFFGRTMQKANVRIGFLDRLAVHLEHETQNTVSRRMLRPEVHCEILDLGHYSPVLRN